MLEVPIEGTRKEDIHAKFVKGTSKRVKLSKIVSMKPRKEDIPDKSQNVGILTKEIKLEARLVKEVDIKELT